MAKKSRHHRDRYDVSGNVEGQYVDEAQTVLVNKQGITRLEALQIAEEAALTSAYESLLDEVRTTTRMTCDLLRHIHGRIFGDLYDWAGRWRTVNISKSGITWPPPAYISENMEAFERDVLRMHPASALAEDEVFCGAAAEIHGEFLVVHPFREGNARTIKLLTDMLSLQTGRPLLIYDQSDFGREQYVAAASAAFKHDYRPMKDVLREALAESRK
jgi:cell filamentation protein